MRPLWAGATRVVVVAAAVGAALTAAYLPTSTLRPSAGVPGATATPSSAPVSFTELACPGPQTAGLAGVAEVAGTTAILAAAPPTGLAGPSGSGAIVGSALPGNRPLFTSPDPGVVSRAQLSGPSAALVSGRGALAPGLVASQLWSAETGDTRALVATPCLTPKAEHWLVSARLATPGGFWSTEGFPASAAGAQLTDLVAGSEGTLGVITDATFRLHERPTARDYRAYLFRSFAAGREAVREIVQAEIPVASLRLSDEDETHFYGALGRLSGPPKAKHRIEDAYLKLRGFGGAKCALIAGSEGDAELVAYARSRIAAIVRRHGGLGVGTSPAKRWFEGRFHGPYLRDPLMDRGLGVDTLETATAWSNVPRLYDAVRRALLEAMQAASGVPGGNGICLAHISHSYADGASLYFTYLWPRATGWLDAEIAQWQAIKDAASDAIAAHGGTISHHHGAGTDHARWMAAEKGPLAMEMLRALKRTLDPNGIMNPGKLGL